MSCAVQGPIYRHAGIVSRSRWPTSALELARILPGTAVHCTRTQRTHQNRVAVYRRREARVERENRTAEVRELTLSAEVAVSLARWRARVRGPRKSRSSLRRSVFDCAASGAAGSGPPKSRSSLRRSSASLPRSVAPERDGPRTTDVNHADAWNRGGFATGSPGMPRMPAGSRRVRGKRFGGQSIRRRWAQRVRALRLDCWVLRRTFEAWVSTVFTEMNSFSAISR